MSSEIDYEKPHFCPAYKRVIDSDLCYESLMCLLGFIKISSVPELAEIEDIEKARKQCRECKYSEL